MKLRQTLRQIEEFYIEELIINEHITLEAAAAAIQSNSSEDPPPPIKPGENRSIQYYREWKELASNWHSGEGQVSVLLDEAEAFFNESVKKKSEAMDESKALITATTETIETESLETLMDEEENKTEEAVVIKLNEKCSFEDEMNKSMTELSSEIAISEKTMQNNGAVSEPNEFSKCIEKLIVSTHTVDKHLDNIQKPNKEFFEFEKQDLKLNAIKQTLESLALALKTCMLHKKAIIEKSEKENANLISKSIGNLVNLHQNVVGKYKEKNAAYLKNNDKWVEFHKDFQHMSTWLDSTLEKLSDLSASTDLESAKLNFIIKDFSNLTSYRLLLERANLNGHEILVKSTEADALKLDAKLTSLDERWKRLISLLTKLKEKLLLKNGQATAATAEQTHLTESSQQQSCSSSSAEIVVCLSPIQILNKKFEEQNEWLKRGLDLTLKKASPVDELEAEQLLFEIKVISDAHSFFFFY